MSEIPENEMSTNKRTWSRLFVFLGMIVFVFILFWFWVLRGIELEQPVMVHISKGEKVADIAKELEDKKVIRSSIFLQSMIAFMGGDSKINLGDYYFDEKISLPKVAYRFARGIHNVQPIKVTIPEGTSNAELGIILSKKLPNFDTNAFFHAIENSQGELFPDTYFFYPLTTIDEIVTLLKDTFNKKTKVILNTGYKTYNTNQILTMASIVEEEANGNEDRDIIAGILWTRLEKGMLLQVDVAPITYKVKGLPDSPITNFGLKSLTATVNPKESTYLFYLHDKDGMIHLARDYAEHKTNIKKYLR